MAQKILISIETQSIRANAPKNISGKSVAERTILIIKDGSNKVEIRNNDKGKKINIKNIRLIGLDAYSWSVITSNNYKL